MMLSTSNIYQQNGMMGLFCPEDPNLGDSRSRQVTESTAVSEVTLRKLMYRNEVGHTITAKQCL